MITYQIESDLVELVRPCYKRVHVSAPQFFAPKIVQKTGVKFVAFSLVEKFDDPLVAKTRLVCLSLEV